MNKKWYYKNWALILMVFSIALIPLAIILYGKREGYANGFKNYFESLSTDRFVSFLWLILFLPYGIYRINKSNEISKKEVGIVYISLFFLVIRGVFIDNVGQLNKIKESSQIVSLSTGVYEVGDDYNSGDYTVKTLYGSAEITVDSAGKKPIKYKFDKKDQVQEVKLYTGDEVKVLGDIKVNADNKGGKDAK